MHITKYGFFTFTSVQRKLVLQLHKVKLHLGYIVESYEELFIDRPEILFDESVVYIIKHMYGT